MMAFLPGRFRTRSLLSSIDLSSSIPRRKVSCLLIKKLPSQLRFQTRTSNRLLVCSVSRSRSLPVF